MLPTSSWQFWSLLALVAVLVAINGLIAGLTLGLLSLDATKLSVLSTSGTEKQKRAAEKIRPIRKRPHLLLSTLLLGNTIINETLPILLHVLFGTGFVAVIVATVLVLLFAELLPQSLCARHGLQIGGHFVWFVYLLGFFMIPVAWPLSKLLDWMLGPETGALYKRAELKEFVNLHGQPYGGDLTHDEVTIVQGTLTLHQKRIEEIMTKLDAVFMLEVDTFLDTAVLQKIADSGHSRVPIYKEKRDNVVGVMLVKSLILLNDSEPTYVRDLILNKVPRLRTDVNLFDALNIFQQGVSHMALVENREGCVIGVVTLEDVIEELIQEEIVDECDVYIDNTQTKRVIRKALSKVKDVDDGRISTRINVESTT